MSPLQSGTLETRGAARVTRGAALAVLLTVASSTPARADKPIDTRLHAALLAAPSAVRECARNGVRVTVKALKARSLEVLPGARADVPVVVEVPGPKGIGACGMELSQLVDGETRWVRVTTPLDIDDYRDVIVSGHVTSMPTLHGSWAPYVHAWCVGIDGVEARRALGMTRAAFLALPAPARRFVCHDLEPPETP